MNEQRLLEDYVRGRYKAEVLSKLFQSAAEAIVLAGYPEGKPKHIIDEQIREAGTRVEYAGEILDACVGSLFLLKALRSENKS